jgi:transposase
MSSNYKAPYTESFKEQMIELAKSGRPLKELAKEFGCHASSIGNWLREADSLSGNSPLSTHDQEELKQLRRRLKQMEMERDILAKATAWFAHHGEIISK